MQRIFDRYTQIAAMLPADSVILLPDDDWSLIYQAMNKAYGPVENGAHAIQISGLTLFPRSRIMQ